jgi:hypothetical protein
VDDTVKPVTDVIPAAASASNKLVDENTMSNAISQEIARQLGYNAAGDGFPTKAALTGAVNYYYNGQAAIPTNNDFFVVLADESAPAPFTGGQTRYRYNGSQIVWAYGINESPFTPGQQATLDSGETAAGVQANTTHRAATNNPHGVTKSQVGLGNVDNTSDADKSVSTAQAAAIALKQDKLKALDGTDLTGGTAVYSVAETDANFVKNYKFLAPAANNIGWVKLGTLTAQQYSQGFLMSLYMGTVFANVSQAQVNKKYQYKPASTTLTDIGANSWVDVISLSGGVDADIVLVRTSATVTEVWVKEWANTAAQHDINLTIESPRTFTFAPETTLTRVTADPGGLIWTSRPSISEFLRYSAGNETMVTLTTKLKLSEHTGTSGRISLTANYVIQDVSGTSRGGTIATYVGASAQAGTISGGNYVDTGGALLAVYVYLDTNGFVNFVFNAGLIRFVLRDIKVALNENNASSWVVPLHYVTNYAEGATTSITNPVIDPLWKKLQRLNDPDPDNSFDLNTANSGDTVAGYGAGLIIDTTKYVVPTEDKDWPFVSGGSSLIFRCAADGTVGVWNGTAYTWTIRLPDGTTSVQTATINWAMGDKPAGFPAGVIIPPSEMLTSETFLGKPVYVRLFIGQIPTGATTANISLGAVAGITLLKRVEGMVTGWSKQRCWLVGNNVLDGGNWAGVRKNSSTGLFLDVTCTNGFTIADYYKVVVYYIK